jgi:hypothetical protein
MKSRTFGHCSLLLLLEFSRFFWLDSHRASSYIVFHHSNLVQMNFPCSLVVLRHWRDLETQQERKKV